MIVGYNGEAQPGLHEFVRDDGSPLLMPSTDETDALAGRFRTDEPAQPFGGAPEPGFGPPIDEPRFGPPMQAAGEGGGAPAAPAAPAAEKQFGPPPPPVGREGTTVPSTPAAEVAAAAGTQPGEFGADIRIGTTVVEGGGAAPARPVVDPILQEINAPVYVGGSPGVDPRRMRAEGVPVPQTQSTEGGHPFDIEAEDERMAAANNLRMARLAEADLQVAKHQNEAAQARAAVPLIERQQQIADRRRMEVESRFNEEKGYLDTAMKFQASKQVDPQALFKERGTLATIGLAIAQGLGAYAAAMTGTRNFAMDLVNQAIDRDIARQEADIRQGRANINDSLWRLNQIYGDMDQAKTALRMLGQQYAATKATETAALYGTKQAQVGLATWMAELDRKRSDEEMNFRLQSLGKLTTQEKFVQPKAATGGGMRAPTLKERRHRAEDLAATTKALRTTYGEPDPAELAIEQVKAESAIKKETTKRAAESVEKYGTKRIEVEAALTGLEALERSILPYIDPATGQVKEDIPATGLTRGAYKEDAPAGLRILRTDKGREIDQLRKTSALNIRKALTGTGGGENEMEEIASSFEGQTDKDLVRGIRLARQRLEDERRKLGGTFTPEAAEQFETNMTREAIRQQVQREQGAKDKGLR